MCWARANKALLVVIIAAIAAFYPRSWEGDLHGDPVHYAAIAKRMALTGDWLTPRDGPDVLYAKKPPVMFWLTAMNFRLFGINTYTAKFWSCAFAVAACVVTYLLGRRLFGEAAGLLAGFMLAGTSGVVPNALDLRLDTAVMFYTALAVYALVRADDDDRPAWLLLAGLAGGFGMMTKASAPLHAGVVVGVLLALRRPRWLIHPCLAAAVALAVVIAAPWHITMVLRYGREFSGTYFGEQIGSRITLGSYFLGNVADNVTILLLRTLPWWPLAAYTAVQARHTPPRLRWGVRLALIWIVAIGLLMAVPPKRYDRYMIPSYPAVALLAGCGLSMLLSERVRAALPAIITGVAVVSVFVMATVPIPIHNERCRGFLVARPLLDWLSPGDDVAGHDSRFPTGPARDPRQWSIRSKVYYYMDRDHVMNYSTPEELIEAGREFVIVRRKYVRKVTAHGYERILDLDSSHVLLHRGSRRGTVWFGP
jgi:4-amino-4-deoxy-L-arabinose transferase-like glycosyltransferase